jgi:drug/metabolite transporter (DMT)-like permease
MAAAGMAGLAALRGESLVLPRRAVTLAALVGVFQFCANFQLVYRAEDHVPSGLVAVIYALMMVPNALLGRLVLKAPVGGRFLAGSGVAIIGIAMLITQEYRLHGTNGGTLLGVAMALGGIMTASIANILQNTTLGRAQPVVPLVAWAMAAGALANGVVAYGLHGAPVLPPSPRFWGGVAYLALVGSVAAFPVYFALIRQIGPGRAAYINVVVPVIAMALSTLFEGYRWSLLAGAGSVVAMVGLGIAMSGGRGKG